MLLAAGGVTQFALGAPFEPPTIVAAGFLLGFVGQGVKICVDTTLQETVEDDFRGRVFAAELTLITLTLAASNYATGEALDRFLYSPRALVIAIGVFFCLPGVLWLLTRRWWDTGERMPRQ